MSMMELCATKYCEESVKSEPEQEKKHDEDSYEEDKRDFRKEEDKRDFTKEEDNWEKKEKSEEEGGEIGRRRGG
jgi:hypothetical protein